MSSPVNAFFKIHLNGQQTGSTPQLLVSGTLHCVETATAKYLPVAYYTDGATANDNSLTNIRVASDAFGFQNGLLSSPADGSGNKFHIVTYGFTLTVNNAGVVVFAYPSLTTPTYTYDLSITFLELTESLTVPVPSYNELDSDVVLTTASPTAWNRPQPVGNDIVIKSNVLTLIYAALYKRARELPPIQRPQLRLPTKGTSTSYWVTRTTLRATPTPRLSPRRSGSLITRYIMVLQFSR